jgi:hypothetical protein
MKTNWIPPEREVTLLPRTKNAEDFSQARLPFVGQGVRYLTLYKEFYLYLLKIYQERIIPVETGQEEDHIYCRDTDKYYLLVAFCEKD